MGIDSRDFVVDKAFKFKQRIEELKSKEYYSDEPKKLISLFDKVVTHISESINEANKDDKILVKRVNLLLSFYHLCLDEIEHIEANNVPVEMLPLFDKILADFKLETTLVFRPSPLYNYSYYPITKTFDEINKSQGYAELTKGEDIAVISFPSSEKNSALLHCSFAHELGHHLNEYFSIADEIEPKVLELIDKELIKRYAEKYLKKLSKTRTRIGKTEVTLDKFILKEHVVSQNTEEFAKIIRKWLDEIISDIIALHLFGPAFLFAIAEFSIVRQDFKKYSEEHPPIFIRLKNLMSCFDELRLSQDLKDYEHVMQRLQFYREISTGTFESEDLTMSNITNMILERGIINLFEPAKTIINSRLKPLKKICDFADIKHAVRAFRNLIPGNEVLNKDLTSRTIGAVSILNAAWIVRINFIDELYNMLAKTERARVRSILNELTLKSLDLQSFHDKMVETK